SSVPLYPWELCPSLKSSALPSKVVENFQGKSLSSVCLLNHEIKIPFIFNQMATREQKSS
ncbi:MAG: hypothetical protein ACRD72_18935, partial [Candidatus Angelobacter sp.]